MMTCDSAIRVIGSEARVTERVRRALPALLAEGAPRIDEAARALRCSARSLQRWLAQEGTTFQSLVDQGRRAEALRNVARTELDVGEVAYRSGFCDASTFFRAFRRWTGLTPAAYRRAHGFG